MRSVVEPKTSHCTQLGGRNGRKQLLDSEGAGAVNVSRSGEDVGAGDRVGRGDITQVRGRSRNNSIAVVDLVVGRDESDQALWEASRLAIANIGNSSNSSINVLRHTEKVEGDILIELMSRFIKLN